MRHRGLTVATGVLVLLALVAVSGFAEYDRTKVRGVMGVNMRDLPRLVAASNSANYSQAAGYLLSISQGMYSIKDYTPLKGDKATWDQTMGSFLKATWRGLAACADGPATGGP